VWGSRKGKKAKEEKGKETPPKGMQGSTTKKRGSASTGLAEMATASSQKPAGLSMKDPKEVGGVEKEATLPLRRSKRGPQPKGAKDSLHGGEGP
jgi:hypothetical protein